MSEDAETQPVAVPLGARRAGDIRGRWPWVEPSTWTERMLTALEQGVKGGKWFSLIDKVTPETTLDAASRKVAANRGAAGVDRVTVAMYEGDLPGSKRSSLSPIRIRRAAGQESEHP